tara:strand:+ start:10240 stop:11562 length:1323 start_codon:yes stop_codon:yes gene_type:complete
MNFKYLFNLLILPFFLVLNTVFAQQFNDLGPIKKIDHIVAVVNGSVITRQELDELLELGIKQLEKQGIAPPPREVLESQMLEREILTRAQIQLANELGMTVGDMALEKSLNRIANANKVSKEEFFRLLANEGISYDKFREEIRNEMLLVRLKEREVSKRIKVTEREIDDFLTNEKNSSESIEEYYLSHIMIRIPELASPEKIDNRRKRAESALAKIKNGSDFGQVAAEFSDADDALEGGRLGWRLSTQLPTKFSEVLQPMLKNEVTPIIKSSSGFHILKLLDRRGGPNNKEVVIDQTHVRHILIKVNQLTSEDEARLQIIRLKERLDNGANFEELAKIHSEDPSNSAGGDLGWVSPGDTVPEFEGAMNRLQLNEISDPVQTVFGWHLVQVIERRTKDVSSERQRQDASNAIRARKTEKFYQEWLQQLRDRAYVEYRAEDF